MLLLIQPQNRTVASRMNGTSDCMASEFYRHHILKAADVQSHFCDLCGVRFEVFFSSSFCHLMANAREGTKATTPTPSSVQHSSPPAPCFTCTCRSLQATFYGFGIFFSHFFQGCFCERMSVFVSTNAKTLTLNIT